MIINNPDYFGRESITRLDNSSLFSEDQQVFLATALKKFFEVLRFDKIEVLALFFTLTWKFMHPWVTFAFAFGEGMSIFMHFPLILNELQ